MFVAVAVVVVVVLVFVVALAGSFLLHCVLVTLRISFVANSIIANAIIPFI